MVKKESKEHPHEELIQGVYEHTYRNAMEDKIGSAIEVVWKKKTGESVKTKVIMVPISHNENFSLYILYQKFKKKRAGSFCLHIFCHF